MRLTRLELSGVGPFEGALFEIPEPKGQGELVLFEGPNGSGKSTILQTIAIACSEAPPGLWQHVMSQMHPSSNHWGSTAPPMATWIQRCRRDGRASVGLKTTSSDEATILTSRGLERARGQFQERLFADAVKAPATSTAWAAFAYNAGHASASLSSDGAQVITESPYRSALSFGKGQQASDKLGQLLTNVESDRVRATVYAQEVSRAEEKQQLLEAAKSRREGIRRFEDVFSEMLDREVTISFPFQQHAPRILFDGEEIPVEVLGEGLRATLSWVADLLVRLERIVWIDITRSPMDQDFWLMLDEVEESLHPKMQARVLPALRKLFRNARIFAATHSPFVVASAGEGTVFAIRPGPDHRVRGQVEARPLKPGQSLDWVVTEIFDTQSGFIDPGTRQNLADHDDDIQKIQSKSSIDWEAFFKRRDALMDLNDEVRTVVAMQEIPVRAEIDRQLRARTQPADGDARA